MKIVLSHARIRVSLSDENKLDVFPVGIRIDGTELYLTKERAEQLETLLRLARESLDRNNRGLL